MSWIIEESAPKAAHTTIALYGPSQSGKTTQIGVLAEHEKITTGRTTRLYTVDPGGIDPLRPYINLGIVEAVELRGLSQPWEYIDKIVQGMLPDGKGEWVLDKERNANIGLWAFDSGFGLANTLMLDAANRSTRGQHIGGRPPAFRLSEGSVNLAGNSESHYGAVQTVMSQKIKQSFSLPGTVLWTFAARSQHAKSKGDGENDDEQGVGSFITPHLGAGRALNPEIPFWFVYTFRLVTLPGNSVLGTTEEHRLYLKPDTDQTTGSAGAVLTNNRVPLDAHASIPPFISPASVVVALDTLRNTAVATAEAAIAARVANAQAAQGSKSVA